MTSGKHVLSTAHALGVQIRRENWPCSAMVAAWLQAVQGRSATSWAAWRRFDPALWDAVNITDDAHPWSGVVAVCEHFGTELAICNVSRMRFAPPLVNNCWHFVQRWKRGRAAGHAYLVYRDGVDVTVYESGILDGYQERVGTWEGAAGLDGYSVGVVPLLDVKP